MFGFELDDSVSNPLGIIRDKIKGENMEIIIKPRQAGKTHELIKRADNHNGYIVCFGIHEAHRIADMAKSMECKINLPITYKEFTAREYYGKGVKKFFIDNVEMFLESLTTVPIEAITLTGIANEVKPEYLDKLNEIKSQKGIRFKKEEDFNEYYNCELVEL